MSIRLFASVIGLFLSYVSLQALQTSTASVNGFVEDSITKETLVGATAKLKGTKLGAYTNKSGYFTLGAIPAGSYTLVVSAVGYQTREMQMTFQAGKPQKLRVQLLQAVTKGDAVVVTAEREEDKRQISISRVNIPMEQLSQIRIGGEADVFRALQMLPGVLTSSQISSGLFIRGGSPDQNLVLLDGMTVYNPTHLFGFISAFNNDAIKDVDLVKGGFPAEFGGRMSAVLNITQKDGNRDHVEGLVGLGLISSRFSLQGPMGNGSFFVGGRRTYLDLVTGLFPEDPESPLPSFNFYDVNVKLSQNLSDDDKVSASGFLTRDNLSFSQPGLDFGVRIGNRATAARWSHVYSPELFSIVNVSASRYDNGFIGDNAGLRFDVNNSIIDFTIKGEFEWFTAENMTVKSGYEGTIYNFTYTQVFEQTLSGNDKQTDTNELNIWDNVHAAYAQFNWNATDLLSLQGGFRANYWTKSDRVLLDPRLAARWQLTDGVAVKAAWGVYHQYLRLASSPDFTFFDTWLPTDQSSPTGRAEHYIELS